MSDTGYSFIRYLESKRSVDDRALNKSVWNALASELANRADSPLNILEIGAGIGTMFHRILEWQLTGSDVVYTALDNSPSLLDQFRTSLPQWARLHHFQMIEPDRRDFVQLIAPGGQTVTLRTIVADINKLPAVVTSPPYDLLIAHAVLDLLNIPRTLPILMSLLKPKTGLYYFTLNFDGLTHFEPSRDPSLDAQIEVLYHQTMDRRKIKGQPSGDSRSGRHLLNALNELGSQLLSAGSSDWVVMPVEGKYLADEAYFLTAILVMIGQALTDRPELDQSQLMDWLALRRQQIDERKLIYLAHQLDVFGRVLV